MERLGWVTGRYWITVFLWAMVLLLVTGREARGEQGGRGRGMAGMKHFAAQELAQDCSVVRSVAKQTFGKWRAAKTNLTEQEFIAKQKRTVLESCGQSQGVTIDSDPNEVQLAQMCPDEYASWMNTSYRMRVDEEDRQEAEYGYQILELYLDWNCPKLPSVVSVEMKNPSDH